MSLAFYPSETIAFSRPLKKQAKITITLVNKHAEPIMFVVKVTSKKYAVRPNAGRIEPGDRCEILIFKYAFDEEPPEAEPCKDKFMFESAFIDPSEDFFSSRDPSFWDIKRRKNAVHRNRIPVTFLRAMELFDGELLRLDPHDQLTFWGPFTKESIASLNIENPRADCVAFKIKTTSSKDFAVYPSMGRLEPYGIVDVKFYRKALSAASITAATAAPNPKIQIISTIIPSTHLLTPLPNLFKLGQASDTMKIHSQKLVVRYPEYPFGPDKDNVSLAGHRSLMTSSSSSFMQSSTSFMEAVEADPPSYTPRASSISMSIRSMDSHAEPVDENLLPLQPVHRGVPESDARSSRRIDTLSSAFRRLLR
ncbi:hypothetical protein HGRIS_005304 [Hohenbuehelia grisea]|uniref:MSP domain-containing protein n=1 Tax=Hohenbuehelia grisea TaxID=104357 RepID=A0ABR3JFN3_9AGAR